MKARSAVDALVVEQRHRRHLHLDGALDQALRLEGGLKKALAACNLSLPDFSAMVCAFRDRHVIHTEERSQCKLPAPATLSGGHNHRSTPFWCFE
jgi:hypothetical protein